jgi:Putative transposase of IS4/5 family (DUF4096)
VLALDPRVVDAVWAAVQGHLPPSPPDTHPLGCHRPRIPDRDCFTGILLRLVTGCSWDVAARFTPAGETTLRNRRTEWAERRRLQQARRRIDRRLRQDHRPGPVRGRRRRQPAQGSLRRRRNRPQPHRPSQDRLEVVRRHRPVRDPDRLGHRRRQPQRQHPARAHPANRRRPRPAPGRRDPAPGPRLRQLPHHPALPRPRPHRHRLRQEETQRRTQDQETTHPGPAMARRTHQLLAIQLRPTPPQHRQVQPSTPRSDGPRHRPHPDRETRQMGQTLDRLETPICARS